MQVSDTLAAQDALLRLNYYRFCGYALFLEIFEEGQRVDQFQEGTMFEQVLYLCRFDADLRALMLRYLEPIEIAFRSAVCYEMAMRSNDSHWYLNSLVYRDGFDYQKAHDRWQSEFGRSTELYAESYRRKYCDPPLPPAWTMCEILSMGSWSKIYYNIESPKAKQAVAKHFGVRPYFLGSWIHSLTVLRNLCAHRCRIWNRDFTIKPTLPTGKRRELGDNTRLSAQVFVLSRLLAGLQYYTGFDDEWDELLEAHPNVPREPMGIAVA